MYTERWTERNSPTDQIIPVSQGAATVTSANPIDCSKGKRFVYALHIGAIAGGATVDAKMQSNDKSDFSGTTTDITGGGMVQVTAGASNIILFEVRADQVAGQVAKAAFIRLSVTVGVAAVVLSAIGYTADSEQGPASQYNSARVTQKIICTV